MPDQPLLSAYKPAQDALESAVRNLGSFEKAIDRLYEALTTGELRAIGKAVDAEYGPIVRSLPRDPTVYRHVSPNFWLKSSGKDQSRWDWRKGRFFNSVQPQLLSDLAPEYRGVLFHTRDLDHILEIKSNKPVGGRPLADHWYEWVAALAVEIQCGGWVPWTRKAALARQINSRLVLWGFDESPPSTVDPALARVIARLGADAAED